MSNQTTRQIFVNSVIYDAMQEPSRLFKHHQSIHPYTRFKGNPAIQEEPSISTPRLPPSLMTWAGRSAGLSSSIATVTIVTTLVVFSSLSLAVIIILLLLLIVGQPKDPRVFVRSEFRGTSFRAFFSLSFLAFSMSSGVGSFASSFSSRGGAEFPHV